MSNGEIIRRRNLPHWDVPTAAYFVTVCLEGSIPARGLLDLQAYRAELEQRPRPADQTPLEWAIVQWKRAFARTDVWLDRAEAVRFLENDELAQIVVDALYFFAGERYDLLGYVVMPNHFHWVFQPLEQWVNGLKPGKHLRPRRGSASFTPSTASRPYGAISCLAGREDSGSVRLTIIGCAVPKSLGASSCISKAIRSRQAWSSRQTNGGIRPPGQGAAWSWDNR